MITIFCDFCGEKMAFFSNTKDMINFMQELAVQFWAKNANFFATFFFEIFHYHKIGPRVTKLVCEKVAQTAAQMIVCRN
jgi:antirestriction protein ArdC